jgi:hypothetical protein
MSRRIWADRVGVLGAVLWAALTFGEARAQVVKPPHESSPPTAQGVPLAHISDAVRSQVDAVLQKPTLTMRGPIEVFRAQPAFYHWLLDHPVEGVLMWRRMGARCMEITQRGPRRFAWTDKYGSNVQWDTIYSSNHLRIWYAEGVATPGPLIPPVSVRAVVILRFASSEDEQGQSLVHQQADLYVQTDSKTASLMARLVGHSAPQLARQCVGQMELFFSALSWYANQHPDRAHRLLLGCLPPEAPATQELRQILARNHPEAAPPSASYNGSQFLTPLAE